jgi:CBS domain-containing protein
MLRTKGITGIPVVNGEKVVGIITRSDLMRYFYDLLPD